MLSVSGLSPSEGAKFIDLSTNIEFTIIDDGNGIDTSSIVVNINADRALTGIEFQNGFNGADSEINFIGNNINIVIEPEDIFEKSKVITIQLQVKNLLNQYLNYTYSFKTILEEPVLISSSPVNDGFITSPQYLYLEFEDIIDGIDKASINIDIEGTDYIVNGIIQSSVVGALSDITDREDGDGVIIRIDPIEPFRNGTYKLNYSLNDGLGNPGRGYIVFTVKQSILTLPPAFPQTGFVGFFQGIEKASVVGDGETIDISWNQIATRSYQSEGYALIYQANKRLEVFDGQPSYISNPGIQSAMISGLDAGKTYSFAVRAMESYVDTLDLTGMSQIAEGTYIVPNPVSIEQNVMQSDNIIYVDSTDGYPSKGFLLIGREIIRYNGKLSNAFLVSTNGRGVSGTSAGIYLPGDDVKLFLQCTDSNTVILMSTPIHYDGYGLDREVNGIGLVVTDYGDEEQKYTMPYDFCGYHRAQPDEVLNGVNDCNSYLGGEFNGYRGMNLFDRLVSREEVLLTTVGEPIILLKRLWNGQTCGCMDPRRVHPKVKSCGECYGTGYVGGYSQFNNRRRNDTLILVSFGDTVEDLKLGSHEHLQQEMEPQAWTTPTPTIRDRDLLVRFDFTGDIEFIYEVLNVSRERAIFNHYTRQRISLKRLDKTSIEYTYPLIIPSNIGQQ